MRHGRPHRRFGFCIPGYRYCGPGCSGPGAPTNAVDACCYMHDMCYLHHGDKMYCDQQFQRCLAPKINPYSKEGKDAAFFSRMIGLKQFFF
ncbi:MAG: Parvovirus coat protein VP1-like protein [Lysinibacillus sp.]